MEHLFRGKLTDQQLAVLVIDEIAQMKKEGSPVTNLAMHKFTRIAEIIFTYPVNSQYQLFRWLEKTSS